MRKRTIGMLAAAAILAAGVTGVYAAISIHYDTHFFEHTWINEIDVSDLTAEEAEQLIREQTEDYSLTVITREGTREVIAGGDIAYQYVSGGEVQAFLESQNSLMWLPAVFGKDYAYAMEAAVTWDEELLAQAAADLDCMQAERLIRPVNAYVGKNDDGTYAVMPEVEGNEPDSEKVQALLKEAVQTGKTEADLETAECYAEPEIRSNDPGLLAEAAVRNQYASMTVTYQMGGGVTEELDAGTIAGWFSLDEEKQPVFDRDEVSAWVDALADEYDTIGTYPPFVTSNGETVYVEARTYGWQMDRETETEELYQLLLTGASAEREPVWFETAGTRGENDIGNTYVEIDYTNQRMWYYKDGMLLAETPVVTGNVGAGMASPEGVFCLVYKEEDAELLFIPCRLSNLFCIFPDPCILQTDRW